MNRTVSPRLLQNVGANRDCVQRAVDPAVVRCLILPLHYSLGIRAVHAASAVSTFDGDYVGGLKSTSGGYASLVHAKRPSPTAAMTERRHDGRLTDS